MAGILTIANFLNLTKTYKFKRFSLKLFLNSFKRGYEHTKCPVLTEILRIYKKNPSLSSFNEREAPKILQPT